MVRIGGMAFACTHAKNDEGDCRSVGIRIGSNEVFYFLSTKAWGVAMASQWSRFVIEWSTRSESMGARIFVPPVLSRGLRSIREGNASKMSIFDEMKV